MTTSIVVADRLNIQVILPLLSEADPGVQERDTTGVVDVPDVVDHRYFVSAESHDPDRTTAKPRATEILTRGFPLSDPCYQKSFWQGHPATAGK